MVLQHPPYGPHSRAEHIDGHCRPGYLVPNDECQGLVESKNVLWETPWFDLKVAAESLVLCFSSSLPLFYQQVPGDGAKSTRSLCRTL